ncbi:MAG: mechanosensitive ion channel family protein [Sulfitobacter sp.]|nr:mechanosensitive ion channel family protein [Sulfitobacter sp.]
MRLLLFFFLLTCVFLIPAAAPNLAQAQGLSSVLALDETTADTPPPNLETVIDRAAKNGVSVVVIDSAGNLMAEIGAPETAGEASGQEAEAPTGSVVMRVQDRTLQFRTALFERLLDLPAAFNEVLYILRAASPDGTLWAFGKALIYSLLLFGVGMVVEAQIFGKRIMKRFVVARIMVHPEGYAEKMPFLVFRFFAGVLGILVSMAVAYVLGFAIFGTLQDTAIQYTATIINIGYFTCRFVAILWRMILSPFLTQYRIPALTDREARRLHRWLWMVAGLDICVTLFGSWIAELGLNYDVYAFLSAGLAFIIMLLNLLLVLVNRRAISGALRHGRSPQECGISIRFLSQIWAPVVILYLIFAWFQLTYDLIVGITDTYPMILGAYAILISIIVVYGVINFLIERSFARARAMRRMNELALEEAAQEAALADAKTEEQAEDMAHELEETRAAVAEEEARAASVPRRHVINSFEALARRIAAILAFVAGTYAFFAIWDNDSTEMVESAADQLLDIMVICFIGYIVYHAFRIWIDDKIEEESGDQEEAELGDEGGGSSASRLATLLPLFRNAVLIVVFVSVVLVVLMEVGINVGPLFAGAGIVGVAIGFGSQALVRDIFAGAFFLFDDAFRKGEYLDVGGVKGTVEKISVRSFQLRHHLGALHTIPFGELQVMTNYSRDWVMMKLPLRVTYDTDVDKVRKLVKKLGQELLEDPVIGQDFIQPLKSQGVIEMQDSAMIIRVKFMTKPGDQWVIRKRVYEEIRALFEREGIKFAHREVTVRLADGKVDELTEEERKAVTSAAHAAIEEEHLEGGVDDGNGDDR